MDLLSPSSVLSTTEWRRQSLRLIMVFVEFIRSSQQKISPPPSTKVSTSVLFLPKVPGPSVVPTFTESREVFTLRLSL